LASILIVDDLAENRYLLETLLRGSGYDTACAANGAEALRLAQVRDFDLVLSDILMPVMDGFALCRAWRRDPRLARIPFVIYTATYTESKDEQFALGLGADRFLIKPLPPEVILREVQALLGARAGRAPEKAGDDLDFFHRHNQALSRKLQEKLAENQRLEASNARFGKILDASLNEILIFDGVQLRFTLANQGALEHLGYLEPELRQLTPLELAPEFDLERFQALLQPLRTGARATQVFETTLRARDGSTYPVEVHLEPILDDTELSFLAVVQDITGRRRQEEERRRLEEGQQHRLKLESLGRMAAGVAHDLNNLLAPILGLAGVMRERYSANAQMDKELGIILRAAERGRELVRGLTEFAHRDVHVAAPVDLTLLVRQAVDLLRPGCAPGVRWELDLAPDLAPVQGDADELSRVLLNLVRNALDAVSGQGTVCIRTRAAGAEVHLAVQDSGCGIAPELLDQVMEPFFTTKARGRGTGLGLAIVNSIVRAHGGMVSIESQVGQGTTVRVQLPAQGMA